MHRPLAAARVALTTLILTAMLTIVALARPAFVQTEPSPVAVVESETVEAQAIRIDRMYRHALEALEHSTERVEMAIRQGLQRREERTKRQAKRPHSASIAVKEQPAPLVAPPPSAPVIEFIEPAPKAHGLLPFLFGADE